MISGLQKILAWIGYDVGCEKLPQPASNYPYRHLAQCPTSVSRHEETWSNINLGWLPRPLRNQFVSAQKISDELWRHLETHKKDGSQWITAEEWQGAVMELGQILCLMKDEGGMYFAPGQSLHVHFEELMQSHTIFFACLFSGFFPKTTVLPAIEEIN